MKVNWMTCIRVGVTVLALYVIIHYWDKVFHLAGLGLSAAMPLLVGCVIAYVVNILMSRYEIFYEKLFLRKEAGKAAEKTKEEQMKETTDPEEVGNQEETKPAKPRKSVAFALKRPICMVLAFLTLILVIVLIVYMIIPELGACILLLLDRVPDAIDAAFAWLSENTNISKAVQYLAGESSFINNQSIDWEGVVKKGADILLNGVGGAMESIVSVVSAVCSTTVTFFIGIIFSIYILSSKEKLGRNLRTLMNTYLGEKLPAKITYVVDVVHNCFRNYIVGQCTEAVILGVLCIVGMSLLKLPYAGMIGTLVGFTALIPVAGAYIGAVVGAFMIFTESPIQAVIFIVFLVILQQLEGNLIYPKVVGSSIGLPGIWVLAAVTIGGGIMGIGGMLLGVPLTAAIYQLIKNDVKKRNTAETSSIAES